MSIFVYGDESGVFDATHHDVFVFGGLIFLNKEARDAEYRRFIAAERKLAPLYGATDRNFELKACRLKNKHKAGLFRSTNHCIRYAVCSRSAQRQREHLLQQEVKATLP